MTRWLGRLAFVLVAAAPLASNAAPLEAPHDQAFGDGRCDGCHSLYVRTPSGASDFSPGCVSCHNSPATVAKTSFQFPWEESQQARPGLGGNQHSWSGLANNSKVGAKTPNSAVIAAKLVDGKLACAVCHDIHKSSPAYAPNSRHTSIPMGVATARTGGTGTGTMTLVSAGETAKGFRVQISAANGDGSAGQFVISNDFGLLTPSWFNWSGSAWVAGTLAGPGMPFTSGADVALNDPAVQVRFSSGVQVGDYWDFYVSYPALRASNVADAFCHMCHSERVMTHVRAGGNDPNYRPDGMKKFSHPVGVAMNANGKGYDRPAAELLDANGALQASGTDLASNALALDAGLVRCTTCHAVHNADSNSLTDDAR